MVARCNLAPQGHGGSGGCGGNSASYGPKAIWEYYCLIHRYKVLHTSKTCNVICWKPGHNEGATVSDTKVGVDFNKDWFLQGNCSPWQWGIASEVESNNGLLNLLKLAITTLDSSNPILLPTNNNSSIADSGLSGYYFGPGMPVNNYDATAPTIKVQVANVTLVQSIASAKLA
jgi:hypothetical protein